MRGLKRWWKTYWYGAPREGKGSFRLTFLGQSASFASDATPRQIARGLERSMDGVKATVLDGSIVVEHADTYQTITIRS